MNKKIKDVLRKAHNDSFNFLLNYNFEELIENIISKNEKAYSIDKQKMSFLLSKQDIKDLRELKNNDSLKKCYNKLRINDLNKDEIINDFVNDIKICLKKASILSKNNNYKNQIFMLVYDWNPVFHIGGYGEGTYPILNKPKYFEFNYKETSYEILNGIKFEKVWKNIIEFQDLLIQYDLNDSFGLFEIDYKIKQAYIYKVYLYLHEAFKKINLEKFNIKFKYPFYIYAREHDCELVNIFVYS